MDERITELVHTRSMLHRPPSGGEADGQRPRTLWIKGVEWSEDDVAMREHVKAKLEGLPAIGSGAVDKVTVRRKVSNIYSVLNSTAVRSDVELDSRRQGTVEKGNKIVALELRDGRDGHLCVRFEGGWVSATKDGTAHLSRDGTRASWALASFSSAARAEAALSANGRGELPDFTSVKAQNASRIKSEEAQAVRLFHT